MEKLIENYILKISGETDLPESIENGRDYLISVEGSVFSAAEQNNGGLWDLIYKFKPIHAEILKDNGETIKSIDRRRMSQKYRNMIEYYRKEKFSEIESEDFYNSFMGKSLSNFDEICHLLEKIK